MQKFLNIIYKIFHKRWVATENDNIQEFVVPSKQAKEIAVLEEVLKKK